MSRPGSDSAADSTTTVSSAPAPALAADAPTTTSVQPLRLGDHVPDFDVDRISVAYVTDEGVLTRALWGIASVAPTPVNPDMNVNTLVSNPYWNLAKFSASGDSFAFWDGGGISVNGQTVAGSVGGWIWHSERDQLAWIAQAPGSLEQALYTYAATGAAWDEILRFQNRESFVWWQPAWFGDIGIALTGGVAGTLGQMIPITLVLDSDGQAIEASTATVLATSTDGHLVLFNEGSVDDGLALTADAIAGIAPDIDVTSLDEGWWLRAPDGSTEPIPLSIPNSHEPMFLTTSASHLIRLSRVNGLWSLTEYDLESDEAPVRFDLDISVTLETIQFSLDDRWITFAGDDLVMYDRFNRTVRHVPFDLGRIVAIGF